MKKFKILFFGLFLSFLICSCANDEYTSDSQIDESALKVGTFVDGDFQIYNEPRLRAEWEQTLKKEGFDVQLFNFKVVKTTKTKTGVIPTILTAQSTDLMLKTAIEIEERNGVFFEIRAAAKLTCSGCAEGCDPWKNDDGKWVCTWCIPAEPDNCKKTVTIEIDL